MKEMAINTEDKGDYVILSPEKTVENEADQILTEFFSELKENLSTFKNSNLILDFSKIVNTDVSKILLFSPLSGKQKERDMSFVVVSQGVSADEIPEELLVVPTIQEAIDIIEMENIERDLGI
jgi:hypothetical protein